MKFNIRHPDVCEKDSIKLLWQDIFADFDKYIENFLSGVDFDNDIWCAYVENKIAAMLFSIPGTLNISGENTKANYIYAVCTKKEYRSHGIMRQLHLNAEKAALNNNVSALILIPATKNLFSLYATLGYKKAAYKGRMIIPPRISYNTVVFDIDSKFFVKKRTAFLNSKNFSFDVNSDKLLSLRHDYLINEEKFDILGVKTEFCSGYVVLKIDKCINILESDLNYDVLCYAANALQNKYGKKKVVLISNKGKRHDYGMIKCLSKTLSIYDIYMNFMFE